MSRERWVDWRVLATELFVVFVGLVAALQVDEWREQRELTRTETVYLRRLNDDLQSYIAFLEMLIPVLEHHRQSVAHVNASLAEGRILDGNTALFESGLIYIGHLPSIMVPRSAYDEMAVAAEALVSTELEGR